MKRSFDNFGAIENNNFSNFDTDFQYADAPAIDPQTTQQLAQLGTQIVGRAAANRAAQNAALPEFEKGLNAQCGKRPAGFRKKKVEEYEKCKTTYTTDFNKRNEDTRATAEATAQAAAASAGTGASGTTGGMSSNAKIGIAVGALAVLGLVIYMVKK